MKITINPVIALIVICAIQSVVIAYGFDPARRQITQDTIDWGYAQKLNQIEPGGATSTPSNLITSILKSKSKTSLPSAEFTAKNVSKNPQLIDTLQRAMPSEVNLNNLPKVD